MSSSPSEIVLELAEEFLDRCRNGRHPSLKEYIDRHPSLAGEILEVFPAMAMMEQIALTDQSLLGAVGPHSAGNDLPPQVQFGDYRILRQVGRGGMGVVYEAEQVSLGRSVALKVLPTQILRDTKQRDRFEREARSAARLHHTNIVPVFGVGEQDGTPYYVMQLIRGRGLDEVLDELERLRSGGRPATTEAFPPRDDSPAEVSAGDLAYSLMSGMFAAPPPGPELPSGQESGSVPADPSGPDRHPASSSSISLLGEGPASDGSGAKSRRATYWRGVARIGVQVAEALEYAHLQGVVHRDIKPSNLLLDTRGTVWVTDFGLAKVSGQPDLTHTGDVLGTLRYMPPEAFSGAFGARGDVYSLGLTLYELLALRPAFDQKERGALVRQVRTEIPERLRRRNPEVPRDLETIVHRAIEHDASHRYETAGELAADLQRFLDDEPIRARRTTAVERTARWARRNPAVASLGGVLAAVLIAVTATSMVVAGRMAQLAERQSLAAEGERQARLDTEAALREAKEQRALADANFDRARGAVDDFLANVSANRFLQMQGMEPLRIRLLESALRFYEQFLAERDGDPAVLADMADAQFRIATIYHLTGRRAEARRAVARSRELYERLAGSTTSASGGPKAATVRSVPPESLARLADAIERGDQLGDALNDAPLSSGERELAVQAMFYCADRGLHDEAIALIHRSLRGVPPDRHWSSEYSNRFLQLATREATYRRLLELRPDDHHLWAIFGRHLALADRYRESVAMYRKGIPDSPTNSDEPVEYTEVLLLDGDLEGYRVFVRDLVSREKGTADVNDLLTLARVCSLSATPAVPREQALDWGRRGYAGHEAPWNAHILALALFRAGRYGEAIEMIEVANRPGWQDLGYRMNDMLSAMVHLRLGHADVARDLFERTDRWCREASQDARSSRNRVIAVDWLHLRVLDREARMLFLQDLAFPADPFTP